MKYAIEVATACRRPDAGGFQGEDLQVAEQRLGLDVEHLCAVVNHLGGGALRVRDVVDVLVEVLQWNTSDTVSSAHHRFGRHAAH